MVLAKPMTYMNLSGGPVTALRDFYKVPLDRVIVVHDELDFDYAGLRLKLGGGDNGHNGLKSMTQSLGRRLPAGAVRHRPPARADGGRPTFVLKDFGSAERKELDFRGGPGGRRGGGVLIRRPRAGPEHLQLLSAPSPFSTTFGRWTRASTGVGAC